MLSTKNVNETRSIPKTIQPGNIKARLLGLKLEKGYEENSYKVLLYLESQEIGADFEGFLVDKDDPNGPRYKGQIGRVKLRLYDFNPKTKEGKPIDRDAVILAALKRLSIALGKGDEVDDINVATIEELFLKAEKVLVGSNYINWCIAGKEYMKSNYLNYELFLPNPVYKSLANGIEKDEFPFENINSQNSELIKFDHTKHIVKKKAATAVIGFQPVNPQPPVSDEFDLD